ncbi:MAG: FHA domain-containing protein, partial [Flavobacteriaceae bacterium]|nr:FHA domain-containing protein [Flavobacteriaceae bacterium]
MPTHKHLRVNSVAIIPGRYLVGRSESCDIVMPYSEVSAIHAILEVTSKVVRIYDMNSKNGTVINGQKIIAKEISVGDTIIFGGVEVKFCEYNTQEELPPVLPVLDPVTGNASTLKSNTTIPSPPLIAKPEVGIELPKESPKEVEDHIPYIVYPLASDPNSDYSEYIFEDTKELYPIFRYEINKQAVEVIILFKDRVYTVDYLPEKNGIYQIAGLKSKSKELEFPYFGKAEKVPFIEIHKGNCIVQQLHNYKMFHLMDGNVVTANDGIVNIGENDIVKLTNDDLEIYVRRVSSPPKVKPAPFFRRDK